jgi:hypothetical protein
MMWLRVAGEGEMGVEAVAMAKVISIRSVVKAAKLEKHVAAQRVSVWAVACEYHLQLIVKAKKVAMVVVDAMRRWIWPE